MTLKLQGVSDTIIQKQGRWRSVTFLQYIHTQIGHLTKDLSTKMSTVLMFQNITAIESPKQTITMPQVPLCTLAPLPRSFHCYLTNTPRCEKAGLTQLPLPHCGPSHEPSSVEFPLWTKLPLASPKTTVGHTGAYTLSHSNQQMLKTTSLPVWDNQY